MKDTKGEKFVKRLSSDVGRIYRAINFDLIGLRTEAGFSRHRGGSAGDSSARPTPAMISAARHSASVNRGIRAASAAAIA